MNLYFERKLALPVDGHERTAFAVLIESDDHVFLVVLSPILGIPQSCLILCMNDDFELGAFIPGISVGLLLLFRQVCDSFDGCCQE